MTLPAEPRNNAYARNHFPTGRKDMTDDIGALIRIARKTVELTGVKQSTVLIDRLADALEAQASTAQTITHLEADLNASRAREELATKRIGELEAERDTFSAQWNWQGEILGSVEDERDALAAQIAEALRVGRTNVTEQSMHERALRRVQRILSAPASDALNRVRAEAWDEGYGLDEECGIPRTNPYRAGA